MYRVLKAGGRSGQGECFPGVGKTAAEIAQALAAGIFVFNCESEPELALIDALAHRRGVKARVALRVNPDVDAATHAYISTGRLAHKFGVAIGEAEAVYEHARLLQNLLIEGVSCHIGSQLMSAEPVMEAVDRVLGLIGRLRLPAGSSISGTPIWAAGLAWDIKRARSHPTSRRLSRNCVNALQASGLHVMIEPGRSIVAEAGVLLTRVLY